MKVDAPGLVAAAQRLTTAVQALGTGGAPHPPLAADPASVGAANRLSTAGAELSAALGAHVSALVASLEHLAGVAVTYLDTDDRNAAAITTLYPGAAGAASVAGSAPPAPPIRADVRAPIPPPAGMLPEALSAAAHSGSPDAGEPFTAAWSQVGAAARDAATTIRSTVSQLPETLDGPASTPAVQRHLLSFADGLDTYADRAHTLVNQATTYAGNQRQARQDIPTPQQLSAAYNKVQTIANANAASGGKFAAALANAVAEKNQLDTRTVTGYTGYHQSTDVATAGEDPAGDPGQGVPFGPSGADPSAEPAAGQADPTGTADPAGATGAMASMLPGVMSSVLGAAGGLTGGLLGAATRVPQTLMQAGTQAVSAATGGLSGLAKPNTGSPDAGTGESSPDGGLGDPDGGGEAPTTPAGGGGTPELGVAPSTGGPPTPAIAPVGASAESAPSSAGGSGVTPMGMPMGAMGGLGGAPGGGGAGGKGDVDRQRKVVVREVPHTEDVTGRVDTNRLSAAAASHRDRNPEPPDPDNPPDPVVRRLVTRPPQEPS